MNNQANSSQPGSTPTTNPTGFTPLDSPHWIHWIQDSLLGRNKHAVTTKVEFWKCVTKPTQATFYVCLAGVKHS
jgi:hypothetical protein